VSTTSGRRRRKKKKTLLNQHKLETEGQDQAATRIQTIARQRQATALVNSLRQEKGRENEVLNQQKLEADNKQHQAATRIQSTARQRQATARVNSLRQVKKKEVVNQQRLEVERQDQAAACIQTAARQRQATTLVNNLRKEKEKDTRKQHAAAVVIQTKVRQTASQHKARLIQSDLECLDQHSKQVILQLIGDKKCIPVVRSRDTSMEAAPNLITIKPPPDMDKMRKLAAEHSPALNRAAVNSKAAAAAVDAVIMAGLSNITGQMEAIAKGAGAAGREEREPCLITSSSPYKLSVSTTGDKKEAEAGTAVNAALAAINKEGVAGQERRGSAGSTSYFNASISTKFGGNSPRRTMRGALVSEDRLNWG